MDGCSIGIDSSAQTGFGKRPMVLAVADEVIEQNRSMAAPGIVSRVTPVHTAVRNCTRDEGGPFEAGEIVVATRDRRSYSEIERPSRTRGTDDRSHAMSVSAFGRAPRARANR